MNLIGAYVNYQSKHVDSRYFATSSNFLDLTSGWPVCLGCFVFAVCDVRTGVGDGDGVGDVGV